MIRFGWRDRAENSPRFLCRPTDFVRLAGAVGRQSALHKENSRFAFPTMRRQISTFRGYQILFSIRNPYINRFTFPRFVAIGFYFLTETLI